jgi:cyclophilin family peptidyl-prolyl cis-trans isomerase
VTALVLLLLAAAPVSDERVLLRTNYGDLVLSLDRAAAPRHAAQILELVKLGAYDGVPILRVQKGYVVQVSVVENRAEPLTPAQRAALHDLPLEIDPSKKHVAGALSMAHGEDPASGRSSFAILLGPAPELDGKFTVFGKLEHGDEVLAALAEVAVDYRNAPLEPVVIEKALALSPTELQKLSLRGPSRGAPAGLSAAAAAALVVVIGLVMAAALLAGRVSPRLVAALALLAVLVAFLALYAGLMPYARGSRWLSAALFLGAIAMFRLMGRFESPG